MAAADCDWLESEKSNRRDERPPLITRHGGWTAGPRITEWLQFVVPANRVRFTRFFGSAETRQLAHIQP